MTAKRILSLFMALVLTLCTACITATAQSAQVTAATALINALPDPSTITDADSEAYAKAVADAWEAVYALAECSEEEMMDISDFNKPFDMLFQLWLLPADLANAPTAIPASEEEVFAQAPWLFNASDVLNALPDGYSTLNAYTSTDDQGNQLGTVLLEQLVACYYDVAVRIEAYGSTLPKEQRQALNDAIDQMIEDRHQTPTDAARFAEDIARFPEQFTADNILDYAADFSLLNEEVEYGWYDLTDVANEDLNKYYRLAEEFQVVIGIQSDDVLRKLEQRIAETCDAEAVATYSPLKMQLQIEEECYQLERTITTVESTLGYHAERRINNLGLFYEYYDTVFGFSYLPPYITGDVDGDQATSAADALLVLQSIVGKYSLTESQELAADVDENGDVSSEDALNILKYVVGKVESLPA